MVHPTGVRTMKDGDLVRLEWNTALSGRDPIRACQIQAGSRILLTVPLPAADILSDEARVWGVIWKRPKQTRFTGAGSRVRTVCRVLSGHDSAESGEPNLGAPTSGVRHAVCGDLDSLANLSNQETSPGLSPRAFQACFSYGVRNPWRGLSLETLVPPDLLRVLAVLNLHPRGRVWFVRVPPFCHDPLQVLAVHNTENPIRG